MAGNYKSKIMVYGVGTKGSESTVGADGKELKSCSKWKQMLRRCYSPSKNQKSVYKGCYVSDDWKIFSNFKRWFDENYKEGYELDKDILIKGNKEYSSNSCIFVPVQVNKFFASTVSKKSDLPTGVTKRGKRFLSRIDERFEDGSRKSIIIGNFDTPEKASSANKEEKYRIAKDLADRQDDPRIAEALRDQFKIK